MKTPINAKMHLVSTMTDRLENRRPNTGWQRRKNRRWGWKLRGGRRIKNRKKHHLIGKNGDWREIMKGREGRKGEKWRIKGNEEKKNE